MTVLAWSASTGWVSSPWLWKAYLKRRRTSCHDVNSAPAALIGSLARDLRVHGRGIGVRLLADAIHRVLVAAKTLPLIAVIAEVNDAHAAVFYNSFGFRPFPRPPERAFLLTASVMTALNGQKP